MTLRRILPRNAIRTLDNQEGKYPYTVFVGDSRRGTSGGPFNDLDTVVYSRSGSISYPTTLPISSTNLVSDLTSSITVSVGSFTKGVAERFIQTSRTKGTYVPFFEVGLHEQDVDKSSVQYNTGTSVSDAGLGFAAPLGEKTKIRFELPVRTATTLNSLTSSAYYYNRYTHTFNEVASSEKTDPNSIRQNLNPPFEFGFPFLDAKFFDALGNYASSGAFSKLVTYVSATYAAAAFAPYSEFYSNTLSENGIIPLTYPDDAGVTTNSKFAATLSQSLPVASFSEDSFLIERATIELPFSAGTSWFRDRTRMSLSHGLATGSTLGLGGPCVVVSLFNQISPTHRELIMSASIIPQGDDSTEIIRSNTQSSQGAGYKYLRSIQGFVGNGAKPTIVVPSGSNQQFTGTLRFDMEARASHGAVYANLITPQFSDYASYNTGTAPIVSYPTAVGGYVQTINPCGRKKSGQPSGRSIFGREYAITETNKTAKLQILNARLDVSSSIASGSTTDLVLYNAQKNVVSPYLVHPSDNLILVISKYHSSPYEQSATGSTLSFALTASHDVVIPVGTIRMTLFGSPVRELSEAHNTLNQNLTSQAVHIGSIKGPRVLDQWNIEARTTYSGSYTDAIVSGSMSLVNGSVARGMIGSKSSVTSSLGTARLLSDRLRRAHEIAGGTQLFARAFSSNERYWDSLVPGIDDVIIADKAAAWMGWNMINNTAVPGTNITFALDTRGILQGDYQFTKGYPFSPLYSTIDRRLDTHYFKGAYKMKTAAIIEPRPETVGDSLFVLTGKSPAIFGETDVYTSSIITMASIGDVNKLFYGFGDTNTMDDSHVADSNWPDVAIGTTQGVTFKYRMTGTLFADGGSSLAWIGVEIRGWKYGVMSGNPVYSSAVFRRDRFGQIRDMLEPRLYGAFYDTVGYKNDGTLGGVVGKLQSPVVARFVNSAGIAVDPETTTCSNLSNEATSSLPYVDGQSSNRGPLVYAKISTMLAAPFTLD